MGMPPVAERVSVIVPTRNEAENIDALIAAILSQSSPQLDIEILVADGGSTDGTVDLVQAWAAHSPVRLIKGGKQGLAGDVLLAARHARGVIVVMDADFSHPPASIPQLVAPIFAGTSDMVVGSRYVAGGSTPEWPLKRRILSRVGGALSWPLTDVRDPMSGFFAVRRERLLAVDPDASGFKIGLEILAAKAETLRVTEVPITFRDRTHGDSKINLFQLTAFVRRLMVLAGGAVSIGTAVRFAIVGALGLAVDFFAFTTLLAAGTDLAAAHITSFVLATVFNYVLNSRWSFVEAQSTSSEADWRRYLRFFTVCLMALFLRGGILATAIDILHWRPEAAILLAIFASAIVNYLGSAFFVFSPAGSRVPRELRWRVGALAVLGYVVVLRLIYGGTLDLLPEEAYYWNYSQHLDIGYLDHPPMVAWLVWLGTGIAGNTEFAVRAGALLCWSIAAVFVFQLTRNLYGKTAGLVALMLFSILPFFFATGLLMMPDAPLVAAWAGALYFLERALINERPLAWLGVGVCIGLGMLSKYTIVLLAPASLLLILVDPTLRRWLWHPLPYLAALIAVLLFSPVIVWNILNDWASFAFQGPERLQEPLRFSLPALFGWILILLTPVGLLAAWGALFSDTKSPFFGWLNDRRALFAAVYTLVPLSVFLVFSLFHDVKLNWTGPVWIALLPSIANSIATGPRSALGTVAGFQWAWRPTIVTMLLIYGAALHYMVLGFPGLAYQSTLKVLPIGWKEFGIQIEALEANLKKATGEEPLTVGMDRYFLSSEIAFYDPNGDGTRETAGRSLFGMDSLMYDRWFDPAAAKGRNILLVSRKSEGAIAAQILTDHFQTLGPVQKQLLQKDGATLGHFYYRIGHNYIPGATQLTWSR